MKASDTITRHTPTGNQSDLRRLLFLISVCVSVFFAIWALGFWLIRVETVTDELKERDRRIRRAFEAIKPGMSRQEVIRLMGEPRTQSTEFYLSQYTGFEKEYERAQRSGSAYYLIWHGGMDITYAIGFDTNDKVTLKAHGGS